MTALGGGFRYVTTSLLGYGGTAERRTASDPSISHEIDDRRSGHPSPLPPRCISSAIRSAAWCRSPSPCVPRVPIASLTIVEAPAVELLRALGETEHYRAFRDMNEVYFTAFRNGEENAIAAMIDFYGGAGTFASWPPRVRAYAVETTAVNILDWASAYGFPLRPSAIAAIDLPTLVLRGGISQPAVQRRQRVAEHPLEDASLVTMAGGAHFMIATHAGDVARAIGEHVKRVEKLGAGQR
jgi:pimeloyl-ACP methyl ester carboxylesterase